jgi:hypothetical protein
MGKSKNAFENERRGSLTSQAWIQKKAAPEGSFLL